MTDLTVTAARVGLVDPIKATTKSYTATEAVTAGQAVYMDISTGKCGVADANVFGKQQVRGLALNAAAAGQSVEVVEEGEVYGFTLTSLDYDAVAYLSDTAGALADAAGTLAVWVGRVVPRNDPDLTKVLSVFCKRFENWA